jgi:uncharacterized protein VirK/YbjX
MLQTFTLPASFPGTGYLDRGMLRAQILLEFPSFLRLQQLAEELTLVRLLRIQPKFIYKYLSPYAALSFTRRMRLAAMLTHYQFLRQRVVPTFFADLSHSPVLWQQQCEDSLFTISLGFPSRSGFEGELTLRFCCNETVLQVISFVIVPGTLVSSASEHALFICQVQGERQPELLKQATKALNDSTPAVLLVHAAYGLASALHIGQVVGISTEEQLCNTKIIFDYAGFWQQFDGQRTAANLFLLAIPAAEKSIQQIKAKHRARTLRKRQGKQQLRAAVAQQFSALCLR